MFLYVLIVVVFLVLRASMSCCVLCISILDTCKWSVDPLCRVTSVIKPHSVSQAHTHTYQCVSDDVAHCCNVVKEQRLDFASAVSPRGQQMNLQSVHT